MNRIAIVLQIIFATNLNFVSEKKILLIDHHLLRRIVGPSCAKTNSHLVVISPSKHIKIEIFVTATYFCPNVIVQTLAGYILREAA